jgi:N-acetylmuramoyl-L-alanine amidase
LTARRRFPLALTATVLLALVGIAAAAAPTGTGVDRAARQVLGHSVEGRAIEARRIGDPQADRTALVVGNIHGDERAGTAVTRRLLRSFRDVEGLDLWVVRTVNPDGLKLHTRRNARGVDLNRNFGYRWQGGVPASSGYYPGPGPWSEPESRVVRRFAGRIRPDVSIWYHQPWGQVLAPCRGDASLQGLYSRLSRLPLKRCRAEHLHGTAISWQNHSFPGSTAFVVELNGGPISARAARRHARAAVRVTRDGARVRGTTPRSSVAGLRPTITDRPIPFPERRKREMAAYSKRHYGKRQWRLRNPKVIVQHVAVAGNVSTVYNTFAPDRPDPELHELPNVCSHFVVGSSGRIFRLVGLGKRCRHTVGLNYTAIGIEHVGFRDADVLGRRGQLRASLRLTRWLRCRFGIRIGDVIGHNESLSSPYHFEKVPSLKQQTHGDMKRASMRVYRRKLRRLGGC